MRRQDELIALYPGRDVLTRKYILSQAEALSLAFDSDELLEFLQGELGDPDPSIRDQALFTLVRFLPGFVCKRYALAAHTMGVWSVYEQNRDHLHDLARDAREAPLKATGRHQAFLFRADGLARALRSVSNRENPRLGGAARMALAQLRLRKVADALLGSCRAAGGAFDLALPYALVQQGESDGGALLELIEKHLPGNPDLGMLVCALPSEVAFSAIMDLADRTDTLGRINLALSLARIRDVDHAAAIDRLRRHGEGWVTVFTLRAMESVGDESFLEPIQGLLRRTANDFLRTQALRALGGIASPRSMDLCMLALCDPSEAVKAQAIESLVRLRCPSGDLAAAATPLLASRSLKARVNAILATTSASDPRLPPSLNDLLLSAEAISRLEAAYCLGYVQNRRALAYLVTLVEHDPSLHVKLQAIKSLSKYPARHALANLIPILRSGDARIALTAARVVSRYEGEEAAAVCAALIEELDSAREPFHQALLLRAIGTLGGRSGLPDAPKALTRGLDHEDSRVVSGAIEGWNVLGGPAILKSRATFEEIGRRGDRRSIPRALMALLWCGDLGAVDRLGAHLEAADDRAAAPAVETSLELGLLMAQSEVAVRYPPLAASLDEITLDDGFGSFARVQPISSCDLGWLRAPEPPVEEPVQDEFQVTRSLRKQATSQTRTAGRTRSAFARAELSARVSITEDDPSTRGVTQLQRHLAASRVLEEAQAPGFNERLRQLTYLIGEHLGEPTWLETVSRNRILLVPVMATLIIVGVLVHATWARIDKPEVVRPPLSIESLFGEVTADPSPGKLEPGREIQAGTALRTGPDQRLALRTAGGNRVALLAGSRMVVESLAPGGASVALEVSAGHYLVRWNRGGRIEVRHGRFTIRGEGVIFSMEPEDGRFTLVVDAGRPVVEEIGAPTRELETGDFLSLE